MAAPILGNEQELASLITNILSQNQTGLTIHDEQKLRRDVIDSLVFTAVFSKDETLKQKCHALIKQISLAQGAYPASIYPLYQAFGEQKVSGFTVPAINIRSLTYDTAACIFQLMNTYNISAVVFEIARSEIDYTNQRPEEYTTSILAGAIKAGYKGPVFLQGDHYQLSLRKFTANAKEEIERIESLIDESIRASFYNIDIDASTLVDLQQTTINKQQEPNFEVTAELTQYIRENQPEGITVSIGGEIGHIGGKNSTVADFEAFMDGYLQKITIPGGGGGGISKVSIQTGTSHGGIPDKTGNILDVKLDFSVLKDIGEVARKKYHIGGAVQHGASTLPSDLFDKFVTSGTLEIHLATGFQNIIYDTIPHLLRDEIYAWLKKDRKEEWEEGLSEEQFLYKTRKKALGPFKEKLWNLSSNDKQPIINALEKQFSVLFEKLKVFNTRETVQKYVK